MGELTERKANCAHCGLDLPVEHTGPCPACGKVGKMLKIMLQDTITMHASLSWKTRREYYQKHKGALAAVIGIAVLSPFLGLVLIGPFGVVAGLVLSGLSYYLGPKAITKVIETTNGNT
jgi:hypothetical protein